jgi:ribosome-associated toxin RatA of RatAB toxin-antitoxin module
MATVIRDKQMEVPKSALFDVITDFESYPKFLNEVVGAKIHEGRTAVTPRVTFQLEVVKRFEYILDFSIVGETEVSWKLLESNFFKTNQGKWVLTPTGPKVTAVHYELEVAFGFLVPSWISRKLTEINLPRMFESFERQAQLNYDRTHK